MVSPRIQYGIFYVSPIPPRRFTSSIFSSLCFLQSTHEVTTPSIFLPPLTSAHRSIGTARNASCSSIKTLVEYSIRWPRFDQRRFLLVKLKENNPHQSLWSELDTGSENRLRTSGLGARHVISPYKIWRRQMSMTTWSVDACILPTARAPSCINDDCGGLLSK